MARVLILSSYVAASRVGGGAQALALARLGIEPILVPTVLFGRHPGHGAPGGAAVEPATFEAMLDGIEAQGLFARLDAVITGHFSSAEQVAIAAATLAKLKADAPGAWRIVDPIMGDSDAGLYVRAPVAEAIAAELLPEAQILAPNAWELARLAGRSVADAKGACAAARKLGNDVLVSSIADGERIGVAWIPASGEAHLASHARSAASPKGTGDLLTAVFAAGLVASLGPVGALQAGAGVVADAVAAARGEDELPIDALPVSLGNYPRVLLQRLDG